MQVVNSTLSIFSAPGTANARYANLVAPKPFGDVWAGVGTALASVSATSQIKMDAGDAEKAIRDLGFQIEINQEDIADQATDPDTYPAYLKRKRDLLDSIRSATAGIYITTYKQFVGLGHSKKLAKEKAKEVARTFKESQMQLFYTLFPQSLAGQRATPTY